MRSIELRELEAFLVLADELHFGRTAQRLGLTQSRISQTLRDLERKLGAPLVSRTSRRVTLTPIGERFRVELRQAYGQLADVVDGATTQIKGTVRVALMFPNVGGSQFIRVVDAFEASNPDCAVEVIAAPPDDPGRPMRSGDVDLLVTSLLGDPFGSIVVATLGTEPRMLAVASNHPLAQRAEVSTEDLAGQEVAAIRLLPDDRQESWVPFRTPSGCSIERSAHRPHHRGARDTCGTRQGGTSDDRLDGSTLRAATRETRSDHGPSAAPHCAPREGRPDATASSRVRTNCGGHHFHIRALKAARIPRGGVVM